MTKQAPMTDTVAIRRYLFGCAHTANFTLVSGNTGKRFTYRLRRANRAFFVDLLTGPDNQVDYGFIGTISGGQYGWTFRYSRKSHTSDESPSVIALDWFITRLNYDRPLDPEKLEFWHSGECSRCGRKLTDPESLARGLGPVCAEKAAELIG